MNCRSRKPNWFMCMNRMRFPFPDCTVRVVSELRDTERERDRATYIIQNAPITCFFMYHHSLFKMCNNSRATVVANVKYTRIYI